MYAIIDVETTGLSRHRALGDATATAKLFELLEEKRAGGDYQFLIFGLLVVSSPVILVEIYSIDVVFDFSERIIFQKSRRDNILVDN